MVVMRFLSPVPWLFREVAITLFLVLLLVVYRAGWVAGKLATRIEKAVIDGILQALKNKNSGLAVGKHETIRAIEEKKD